MTNRFVLALLILLTAPLCLQAQPAESAEREREEYAVYSVMIPEIYHNLEGGIMLIANPTWRYAHEISRKEFQFFYPAPIVSQETLDDFLQRNKTDRWLTRKFQLDFAYILANSIDIKRLIGDSPLSDWKDFFKEYPASHGFFRGSRVGFNQSMDQALVYGGWSCPGLCGQWEFSLLIKRDGVWKVVNSANRVVS
jgi:hypothetical protein